MRLTDTLDYMMIALPPLPSIWSHPPTAPKSYERLHHTTTDPEGRSHRRLHGVSRRLSEYRSPLHPITQTTATRSARPLPRETRATSLVVARTHLLGCGELVHTPIPAVCNITVDEQRLSLAEPVIETIS